MRYEKIQPKYRQFFFDEMKKDFSKMIGHERYDEFIESLEARNRAIFENCISSESISDFDFKMSKFKNPNKIQRGFKKVLRAFKK